LQFFRQKAGKIATTIQLNKYAVMIFSDKQEFFTPKFLPLVQGLNLIRKKW
jgi:hypothetical protein